MSDETLVPNNSIVSPALGTIAPNSSICGVPIMPAVLTDELTRALLQAKLYQTVAGVIPVESLFADLSLESSGPVWAVVLTLLKKEDLCKFVSTYPQDFVFDLAELSKLVAQLR